MQLACEMFASLTGGDCKLPTGTVQRVRQGVTTQMTPFLAWGKKDGQWATGLPLVDLFLSTWNPAGLRRRPTVWSPGGPSYARIVGA